MNFLFQIEIPKRSQVCVKGLEKLSLQSSYFSLLLEDDEKKITRQDFCPKCWEEVKKNLPSGHTYWNSKQEAKAEIIESKSTRLSRGLTLLKDLISQSNSNKAELFVLALFLAHARQLYLRREFDEGGVGYNLYEIAHEDQFVTIQKIDLSLLEIKSIQESLSKKLAA